MARAMGIESGEKLIEMIERGGSGIAYHFREPIWRGSVGSKQGRRIIGYEYFFQESCFKANVRLGWKLKKRGKTRQKRSAPNS
jgi:hypothetical protein